MEWYCILPIVWIVCFILGLFLLWYGGESITYSDVYISGLIAPIFLIIMISEFIKGRDHFNRVIIRGRRRK